MTNNFDAESAKKIIYEDNINVTESNPLKDLLQICINIGLFILFIYISVFVVSGIVLSCLSPQKQVIIENLISPKICPNKILISETESERLNRIKHNILSVDEKFPKTSNLDINILNDSRLNALCYPNGNIYITSSLYKELKTDEELTFVIAHEMAHYKHKDHLLNLRRGISNGAVLIIIAFANSNNENVTNLIENTLNITELGFSRGTEAKADRYAVKIMNKLYGNSRAGVKVMETLKDGNRFDVEFLSTHPNIDKRIKYIQKFSN